MHSWKRTRWMKRHPRVGEGFFHHLFQIQCGIQRLFMRRPLRTCTNPTPSQSAPWVAQHAQAVPAVNSAFSSKHEGQQLGRSRQQERQQERHQHPQQERHPMVEEQVCRYSWHVRALELPARQTTRSMVSASGTVNRSLKYQTMRTHRELINEETSSCIEGVSFEMTLFHTSASHRAFVPRRGSHAVGIESPEECDPAP